MERYNIFYQVHKGLRAMLYETALQLQQTDFVNIAEAEQAITHVKMVVELFEKHAATEDGMVFSALQQYEPSIVTVFEAEHVKDHELGENLEKLLSGFAGAITNEHRLSIGASLNIAFIEFMVFNLEHMAKEEDIINKFLWKYYSDDQLHGITQQIIASIPPQHMQTFSKWMMRGLSNNEIAAWLKDVKNNAPEFIFHALHTTASEELSSYRLQAIEEALSEGAMIA